jgi:hypothetical protein
MLMILGFIVIIAALYRGFMLIKLNNRPREKAEILEITMKKGVTARKNKAYPYAKIKYFHNTSMVEQEIALRSKHQVGDQIEVTFDPNNAKDVDQFVIKKDVAAVVVVLSIGLVLVIGSFILIAVLE